ncbi:replication initiator protein [Microviridae sp.]|nr:replication initiator protein [Microviridae sp.]
MHEAQMHEQSCFITLTYNDENLPDRSSLVTSHVRNFMKYLRKYYAPKKIRFLLAGEYGNAVGHRPHYHALLFGHEFQDKILYDENEGILTYTSAVLENLWGKGFCTIGDLTFESAAYVARYCLKKIKASDKSPDQYLSHYETVCPYTGEIHTIQPEFARMSNRPGIGLEWYEKYHSDIFPHDTCVYKGRTIPSPRYYEKKLKEKNLLMYDQVKEKRLAKARLYEHDNTPERLRVKETVKIASMQNIYRKLHNET